MKLKRWQYVIIIISLFLMFFNRFFPTFGGLEQIGVSTLSIFAGTMLMMILIDLTWPVLLCVAAFAVSGIYTLPEALKMSLGHNLFWFVALNTTLLSVLVKSGILKRLAVWMITRPITKKNPWYLIIALFIAEIALGAFMNCTVVIFLFCGLVDQIFKALNIEKGNRTAEFIMMGILIFCGLSYGFTPFGHPAAILGIEMFGKIQKVNYLQYMMVGAVVVSIVLVIFLLAMKFIFKIDMQAFHNFDAESLKADIGPITKEEIVSGIIFMMVVVWWVLPGVIQNSLPEAYAVIDSLGYTFPVIIAIGIMCILPVNGRPMLNFLGALSDGSTAWQAGFPMASAMLLSATLTNSDVGITDFISMALGPKLGSINGIVFVILICLIATICSNFTSVTVSLMLSVTMSVTLIQSGAIANVNPGALCIALSNAACFSFATPVSTYGAVVAGTGWVTRNTQFKQGALCGIVASIIFSTIGYAIGCMIF